MIELKESDIVFPDRSLITNKGDAGRVLVIGGDTGMSGAAFFSAEASYRCGAGLVEVSTHPDNRVIIGTLIPEAIWSDWQTASLEKADAVVIGVGLGKSESAQGMLEKVIEKARVPLVIDADAVNILSENKTLLSRLDENCVLTPHVGELARLVGRDVKYVAEHLSDIAREVATEYKISVIAKSKVSYIALPDGSLYRNTRGSSALSKGGTGDVLTGVIAALLAGGLEMKTALTSAVLIHAIAGERAGERYGERGVMTRDVINALTTIN